MNTVAENAGQRTFALTVAYDGTRYSGWQVQPNRLTIQGELEKAVQSLAGYRPEEAYSRVLGSGRTDAGVHAVGQVARCVMPRWRASPDALGRAINSKLPDDILVKTVRETVPRFHPIADAVGKEYRFQLQVGGIRDPFFFRTWYRTPARLDFDLLNEAASRFEGTHDFAAFQAAGAVKKSTIRTIFRSGWRRLENQDFGGRGGDTDLPPRSGDSEEPQSWVYEVEGNGFLYNMVRNLVGTMLEVARGRHPLLWIDSVIESGNRKMAGPTAPPQGLFLNRVDYPDEVFRV